MRAMRNTPPPTKQTPSLYGKYPSPATVHPLAYPTPPTYPTIPGAPHMPHTPATHLTITPKCAYINGEPVSVTGHGIKLSDPTPTDIQTVTLTITPTTVTILNDDDPDTINAAHEAVTRHTRDETDSIRSTYILPSDLADMLATRKR